MLEEWASKEKLVAHAKLVGPKVSTIKDCLAGPADVRELTLLSKQ